MELARKVVSRAFVVLVVACALWVRPAAAQTGTVSGNVVDEAGAPLAGAEVQIVGTSLHAPTDDKGHFEIRGVTPGVVTVRALLLGFKATTRGVTVTAGESVDASITLVKAPIPIPQVEVVVGSRAKHTAADELAVPVDVYNSDVIARQGTTETGAVLQALSPSINFPHQSVTDATDIVRPFTLRGLSPDQTLVLINGWRRHQTALVNTFAYGMPAGSSGVDLNAIPSSAIERVEVLRDGASAEYGSDAIAGVVDIETKRGRFAPFVNLLGGEYVTPEYPHDGRTANVSGGWGLPLGRGSLGLFGEVLDAEPTNRAWADPYDDSGTGLTDVVDANGHVVQKNNPVPEPNGHWGDGLEKDYLSMLDLRLPLDAGGRRQLYGFGGYSFRRGSGYGYRRYASSDGNWASIYPLGYLPEYRPDVTDYSMAAGVLSEAGPWKVDVGGAYGHNDFHYQLRNTLNASLGGSLTTPTAPGPDGIPGNADDPGIPNQTSFDAGKLGRDELTTGVNASTEWKTTALPNPVNVALGGTFRWERYEIDAGERASWIDGGAQNQNGTGKAAAGSQVFPGFSPTDASTSTRNNVGAYLDLESNLTSQFLGNIAGRYEHYSDFGSVVTGKLAMRFQPTPRIVFRAAASNGFRAPGLSQIHFSKVITNFINGQPVQVGVYPVDHPASKLLGSKPLKDEKSINFSGGVAVTPADGLTLTVDYFDIKITDRILLSAEIVDSTTLAPVVAAGYDVGGLQYFTNGLDTRTNGIDLTADWRHGLGRSRTLGLTANANYTRNKITRVAPLPAALANTGWNGLLDVVTRLAIEKERPDWRASLTGNYGQGPAHGLARVSYYGTFSSAQPGFCDDCGESYGAKTLVDAEAGYKIRDVDVSVGAKNVFDTYPDHPKNDFNNNFATFPWAAASPFGYNGRYLYTKASLIIYR